MSVFLRYLATTWRMGRPQRPAQLRCFAASPTATGCGFGSPVLGDKRAARLLFLMGCLRSYSIALSDDRNLPVRAPAEPHGVLPATHGHVCQCRAARRRPCCTASALSLFMAGQRPPLSCPAPSAFTGLTGRSIPPVQPLLAPCFQAEIKWILYACTSTKCLLPCKTELQL